MDGAESFIPAAVGVGHPGAETHGDAAAGLAAASVQMEATYDTPAQYHNAMEPHAVVAAWDGDTLSLDTPSQGMAMAVQRIAGLFGVAPEGIHIRSPFLGGGFGSKGLISGPQILGIMAARMVGRPVKLVLRREQMFGPVGHRAATRQTLRMGVDGAGALTALTHHAKTATSTFDDFIRAGSQRLPYAVCQPGDQPPRTRRCGSTPAPRYSCAHPARHPAAPRWKVLSTRWRWNAAWTRWRSG